MTQEFFSECVRRPQGMRYKLRAAMRGAFLSCAGTVRRPVKSEKALRFLMAHYVFDDQRQDFERQIKMLRGLGDFISSDEAVSMLRGDMPVDGNYFHLSFDDGLDCLARNAAPILDAAHVPALVFVNSALAGKPSLSERKAWEQATNYAAPLRVMDWDTLATSGFEIGAHTRTHVRLSDVSDDPAVLTEEISSCKDEIESALGRPCRYFAWPFGRYSDIDEASLAAIRSAGFEASFSAVRGPIIPGRTDDFMIPRHHFEPQWPVSHLKYFLSSM